MHNSAFWSVVLVLAVLTGGCGEGPDTTGPPQEVPPATEKVSPAEKEATASTSLAEKEPTTTEQSPELKVLQRFIGSWEVQVVSKPAEWTPEKTTMTFRLTVNWILRGRMIEQKSVWSSGNRHGLTLMAYDPEDKVYLKWHFDSAGSIPRGEIRGKWDEATKTFTWTGRSADGTTLTQTDRFIDKDTQEVTLVIKDRTGKVCLDMEGKAKRKGPDTTGPAQEVTPAAENVPTATEEATPAAEKGITLDLGGGVTMELVLIPAGEFMMGSPQDEEYRSSDEGPVHRVRITKPFYLGVYEVTQEQYEKVMGDKPWSRDEDEKEGPEYPATYVSWENSQEFCRKLSSKEGRTYRLPTEAEWEYACRAGSKTRYSFGDDESELGTYAWYDENADDVDESYSHRVGLKRANAWGLYDMHGNAEEWCQDWYSPAYYGESPEVDPKGPGQATSRVVRGGSWGHDDWNCCAACRDRDEPGLRRNNLGFRVAAAETGNDDQPRPSDGPDSKAIDELCRQARRDWVEKRFAQLESSVWKDRFVHYSLDYETGQPVIGTFDTIERISQNLTEAFDEIAPHPASTQFEVQSPVAVVRLPLARCRKGEQTSFANFLAIAARQNGRWKIAAAVLGDWKLTDADRFDPQNKDHQALQAFYDRVNQVIIRKTPTGCATWTTPCSA